MVKAMVNTAMVNTMIKAGLILVGIILVCSLIGVVAVAFVPPEKTSTVTLVNYGHQGAFNYKGYSTVGLFSSQYAQPNPVLFPEIIDHMEILFAYSGAEVREAEMKAVLVERNGNWQKEIPIKATGGPIISFPLDLDRILELGDTISDNISGTSGGRGGGSYLLRIIAEVPTESGAFEAVLEGELSSSTLKWEEDGFGKIERGFPGGDDVRQGAFGYKVWLKENELFGRVSLERSPDLPMPVVIDPNFPLFTDLVESMDIGFNYQFYCDAPAIRTEEVTIKMEVAEPGRWKKSFTLVPLTEKEGKFTINLPLDIEKLRAMAEGIDAEIGGRGAKEQEVTIFARVHTIAQTDHGSIDEDIDYQLKGKIGEKMEWGVVEEEAEKLVLNKKGAITKEVTELNLVYYNLRNSSLIGLAASFSVFCALAGLFWWRRPELSFLERELKRNRKKYGELISEVSDFPPIKNGANIIPVSSLEALVNIANNSLKPILLKVEPESHTYYIFDGWLMYEHIVGELALPTKKEQTEDERFQT